MPGTLVREMRVDDDAAALVQRDADLVEAEAVGVGRAADGDQHDIGLDASRPRRPPPARRSTFSALPDVFDAGRPWRRA